MKLTFPVGSVIKCFVILSNIKIKQTAKKKPLFFARRRVAHKCALVSGSTALSRHVRVERLSCCFLWELHSFYKSFFSRRIFLFFANFRLTFLDCSVQNLFSTIFGVDLMFWCQPASI